MMSPTSCLLYPYRELLNDGSYALHGARLKSQHGLISLFPIVSALRALPSSMYQALAYVEASQPGAVGVEGLVVELDKLLCSISLGYRRRSRIWEGARTCDILEIWTHMLSVSRWCFS